MAKNLVIHFNSADEDYIDMELTTLRSNSSPQSREFEFQMSSSISDNKEANSFPADKLFYKGKLLPLNLLRHPTSTTPFEITKNTFQEDHYYTMVPFITCSTAPCTNTNTPLASCNISPAESCRVSCELNPDDYFFEWSAELSAFISTSQSTKKPWSKKLKHSILGQKLKASRAYLKSFFSKSACSEESCDGKISKQKIRRDSNYPTIASIINNIEKHGVDHEDNVQRRSFSGAIKRHAPAKGFSSSSLNSSSGSSSSSSNFGFQEAHALGRISSVTEIEGSIEAAIAHCKKSQEMMDSGICSLSAEKNGCGKDQNRAGVCSI